MRHIVLLLLCAGCASARMQSGPIETDRPDFTESASTIAPGYLQLESGYTFARRGDERSHAVGELLLRAGATARSELRLDLGSYAMVNNGDARVEGVEDLGAGLKVKLLDGGDADDLALSLIAATTLPTGASPFREHTLQPELKLVAALPLTERLSFGANANFAWLSEGGARYGQAALSATFGLGVTDRVGAYAESFAFLPASRGGAGTTYGNAGLTFQLTDALQLDARAGVRLLSTRRGEPRPDHFVGVGVATRW